MLNDRTYQALKRQYRRELRKLNDMTGDFSEGSDQRFIAQRRQVATVFDELYRAEQSLARSNC